MNTTQFEITNAVGTPEQIAKMTEQAINMAKVTSSVGATVWVHDYSDPNPIAPTVTVKKIEAGA